MYDFGDKVYCIPNLQNEFEPIEGTVAVNSDYTRDDLITVRRVSDKYKCIALDVDNIFYNRDFCNQAIMLKIQFNAIKKSDIALKNQA